MTVPGFSTEKIKTESSDGHHFVVIEAFTYTTLAGEVITVPVGSETDGASTPHILWPTLPPFGKYWRAAVLHDYLYRYTGRARAYCDAIMLEAMEVLGVDTVTDHLIYDGVVQGGQAAFDEDRKEQGGIT